MPRSPRSESIRWDRGFRWHLARFTIGAFVSAAALGLFLAIAQPPIRHLYEVESCVALFGLTGVLALACIGARDGAPSGRVRFGALTAGPGFAILGWIFAVLALWDHVVISAWKILASVAALSWRSSTPSRL